MAKGIKMITIKNEDRQYIDSLNINFSSFVTWAIQNKIKEYINGQYEKKQEK